MRIKLYKMRLTTSISLNQKTPYLECFFAARTNERVKIEHFNPIQKLLAEPIVAEESVFLEKSDYKTVKEYKKEIKRRTNAYCTKVDTELSRFGR